MVASLFRSIIGLTPTWTAYEIEKDSNADCDGAKVYGSYISYY